MSEPVFDFKVITNLDELFKKLDNIRIKVDELQKAIAEMQEFDLTYKLVSNDDDGDKPASW